MTQLTLSNDLSVITAEINSYKQIAGQTIFEIGRRLKHVRDGKLAEGRGGWTEWLRNVSLEDRQARRFIQAVEDFKEDDVVRISPSKIFELLQLPDTVDRSEFIETAHTVPSTGETKTVDEMTVRELREVKQALKDAEAAAQSAEQRAKQAEAARKLAIEQNSEQQDKLLKQIEELTAKKGRSPEDEQKLQQLQNENQKLTLTIRTMQDEFNERFSELERKQHDLRKMKENLNKTRAYVEVDLSAAFMHFRPIHEQKEAIDVVLHFWRELDETIAAQRSKWLSLLTIDISEVNHIANGASLGRQPVIIDANTR